MEITNDEMAKITILARLYLSKTEVEQTACQLHKVLDYMTLLNEVETEHVEPMTRVIDDNNRFRDDVVTDSLDKRTALNNAAFHDEEYFLVPRSFKEMHS